MTIDDCADNDVQLMTDSWYSTVDIPTCRYEACCTADLHYVIVGDKPCYTADVWLFVLTDTDICDDWFWPTYLTTYILLTPYCVSPLPTLTWYLHSDLPGAATGPVQSVNFDPWRLHWLHVTGYSWCYESIDPLLCILFCFDRDCLRNSVFVDTIRRFCPLLPFAVVTITLLFDWWLTRWPDLGDTFVIPWPFGDLFIVVMWHFCWWPDDVLLLVLFIW